MNRALSLLAAAGAFAALPSLAIMTAMPAGAQGYGYAAPAYTPPGYTPPANYTPPQAYTPPANYVAPATYPAANCYTGATYTPPNAYLAGCTPPQQWVYYCQAKYGTAFNIANGYFKANDGYFYYCQ